MRNSSSQNRSSRSVWKYAGLTTQLFAAIGLTMYGGWYIDKWLSLKMPIAIWVLPLLTIIGIIIKIIMDTNRNSKNKKH